LLKVREEEMEKGDNERKRGRVN
jgi:hypothetical protein